MPWSSRSISCCIVRSSTQTLRSRERGQGRAGGGSASTGRVMGGCGFRRRLRSARAAVAVAGTARVGGFYGALRRAPRSRLEHPLAVAEQVRVAVLRGPLAPLDEAVDELRLPAIEPVG